MTKQEVLEIFVQAGRFITPDAVCNNCAAFLIAVLSTATSFVYTGRACSIGKRFMVGLSTRFLSAESNGCGSSARLKWRHR